MIKKFDVDDFYNPYIGFKRSDLGKRLARLQRLVKEFDISVLIIIDGWESSGKGYVINDLMRGLDPRSSKVQLVEKPSDQESSKPFLWRFWRKIPKKGDIAIFDRSFYYKAMNDLNISEEELERDITDISAMEKQLFDDNMVIIKYFLNISEETQKERIEKLKKDENGEFFIIEEDIYQNNNYNKYLEHFERILELSNFNFSPWRMVPAENRKLASKYILGKSVDLIQQGIDIFLARNRKKNSEKKAIIYEDIIGKLDLSLSVSDEFYDDNIKKLQKEARDIALQFYIKGIPCVLAFEGMDAAGKGGAIERLTRYMDPRGYEVIPTSAPDETELSYNYLWRFYRDFPNEGRISIFDRSWYGRVMVERIEGFADEYEWKRAYDEINQMEKHLHNFGTLVLKFFICIDKDEQLERFKDREKEANKLYKITDEDWRNRDKWDEYIVAMNEMLVRTNTEYAPWIIVEGNDKQYARLKVLEKFIEYGRRILA